MSSGSQIWANMTLHCNMTINKLLQWKRKSYLYIAKSEKSLHEYTDTIHTLNTIINIIQNNINANIDNTIECITDLKVFKQLLFDTNKIYNNILKKEKKTWSKAFSENSNTSATDNNTTNNTTTDNSYNNINNSSSSLITNDIEIQNILASLPTTTTGIKKSKKKVTNSGIELGTTLSAYLPKLNLTTTSARWFLGLGVMSVLSTTVFILFKNKKFR